MLRGAGEQRGGNAAVGGRRVPRRRGESSGTVHLVGLADARVKSEEAEPPPRSRRRGKVRADGQFSARASQPRGRACCPCVAAWRRGERGFCPARDLGRVPASGLRLSPVPAEGRGSFAVCCKIRRKLWAWR